MPVFVIPIHLIAGIPGKRYSSSFSPYWKMGWEYGSWLLSSFPLGAYNKGIERAFYLPKCLGGILHLKPTAGCQMSTLISGFRWEGPYKYPMKNCRRTAKFFPTWGLSQRYCQGLKWLDVIVLQRNAMLWDIPCSKNSNVIPGISVFIGHASRHP